MISYLLTVALPWMLAGGLIAWVVLGRVVGNAVAGTAELPPVTAREIERAHKRCRADLRRVLGKRSRVVWRPW